MNAVFTNYQSKFFANYLTSEGISETDALTQSLSAAKVDLNPHQVDAATFALRSPLSKSVLLADEVGLGKTIEVADLPDGGGKSLRDLTLDAGADPQVYCALLHLMRKGELRCIAHEIITPQSIVIRTDC